MGWLRKSLLWMWAVTRGFLYLVFALVCAAGLYSSWTAQGYTEDRSTEYKRLSEELGQERMHGQELTARVDALATRNDVRIQVIRSELGYVRPGEKVMHLK